MGVQITRSFGELSKRLKKGCLEPTMRKISKHLQSSAVGKINRGIKPENSPLTQELKQGKETLKGDTGNLMGSIAPHHGKTWAAASTNLSYARINQEGGTITAKGKALAIPASFQTKQLMRKYNAQKPHELIESMKADGYSVFKLRNANGKSTNIILAKKGRGKPFALFVIKRSVKIPSRPFLYIDEQDEKYISREIKKAVHEALQGGKK